MGVGLQNVESKPIGKHDMTLDLAHTASDCFSRCNYKCQTGDAGDSETQASIRTSVIFYIHIFTSIVYIYIKISETCYVYRLGHTTILSINTLEVLEQSQHVWCL